MISLLYGNLIVFVGHWYRQFNALCFSLADRMVESGHSQPMHILSIVAVVLDSSADEKTLPLI